MLALGGARTDPITVPSGMEFGSIEFAANGFSLGGSGFTVDNGITVDAGVTGTLITANVAIGCSGSLPINVGEGNDFDHSPAASPAHGAIDKEGPGNLILSGANDYTGGTMVRGGTLQFGDGTANGNVPVAGDILDDTALVFNYLNNQTYGGVISGWGSVTQLGSGALMLTSANTYSGDTRITNGTLVLDDPLALQDTTLDMNGADAGILSFGTLSSAIFGGLAGSRDMTLENTSSDAVALTVGSNNTDTTYSGALTGAGSLTKTGSGMLTLSGELTYTGDDGRERWDSEPRGATPKQYGCHGNRHRPGISFIRGPEHVRDRQDPLYKWQQVRHRSKRHDEHPGISRLSRRPCRPAENG